MSRSSSDQIDIANVNEDADGNEYENLSDEYILLKTLGLIRFN
ncbi:hypothetical protein [Haloquadratum walsbyi]|jgi:hypothetical protein|uniref:Uncharacterized protein n=1 Tax=Haloquadratum walsbyi J07HQW2 TaxID=1238425 RepID=U1PPB8_9EURY|nr:hypothetical protein [Haloquadratum walsbyi]ERG95587.1 MAG: hypothetical protein J07HQW2_02045 [Haloquadratum walsbyi J07HQW2]